MNRERLKDPMFWIGTLLPIIAAGIPLVTTDPKVLAFAFFVYGQLSHGLGIAQPSPTEMKAIASVTPADVVKSEDTVK